MSLQGCFRAGLVWEGGSLSFTSGGPFNVSMSFNTWPADYCQDITLTPSSDPYLPERLAFAASHGSVTIYNGPGCVGGAELVLGDVQSLGPTVPSANYSVRMTVAGTHTFTVRSIAADLVTVIGQSDTTIHVNAAATSGSMSTISATGSPTANAVDAATVTVTIRDAYGNVAPGRDVEISSSRGVATDSIAPSTATTDANGQAIFQIRSSVSGVTMLSAVETTWSVALSSSSAVSFSAQIPSASQSTATLSSSGNWTSGVIQQVVVTLRDASGVQLLTGGHASNVQMSYVGTGSMSFSTPPTDNANGTYTFDVTPVLTGSPSITISYFSGAAVPISGMPLAAAIGHGTPASMAMDTPVPAGCLGGEVCSTPLKIMLKDAAGNPCNSASGSITVATGGPIAQGATENLSGGVAVFSNLIIDPAGSYTLSSSWSGNAGLALTGSPTMTINVGSAYKLLFSTSPGNGFGGQAWATQPSVSILDRGGNTVSTSAATIQLTHESGTGTTGAVLSGPTTLAASSGVATFSGLSFDKAGVGYQLRATSSGLVSTLSAAFTVSPGPFHHVTWTQQPLNTQTMSFIQSSGGNPLQVEARDQGDNLVASENGSFTVTIFPNPGGANLFGTTSLNFVGGIGTINGLSINKAGSGYTLATVKDSITTQSAPFDILLGPVYAPNSTFVVTGATFDPELGAVEVGLPSPQPTARVTLRDIGGNLLSGENPSNISIEQPSYVAGESHLNLTGFSNAGAGEYTTPLSGQFAGRPIAIEARWNSTAQLGADVNVYVKTPGLALFGSTIEMVDHALEIPGFAITATTRTQTYFDPAAYDGSPQCKFEAVIETPNMTAGSVSVQVARKTDSVPVLQATFSYPDGTLGPKRVESASALPCSSFTDPSKLYVLRTDAASAGGAGFSLKIYAARLKVSQTSPTRTRLYIPLTGYRYNTVGDSSATLMTTTAVTYNDPSNQLFEGQVRWKKNFSEYGTVVGAHFTGVAISGALGAPKLALFKNSTDQVSNGGTPVELVGAAISLTPQFLMTPLPMSLADMPEGSQYTAQIRSSSVLQSVGLMRAGIMLDLKNLTQAEVYLRIGMSQFVTATSVQNHFQRQMAPYTASPNVSFVLETSGYITGGGTAQVFAQACGILDSIGTCSDLNPPVSASSGFLDVFRTPPLDFSGVSLGDRIIVRHVAPAGNTWNSQGTFLVGKVAKYQ